MESNKENIKDMDLYEMMKENTRESNKNSMDEYTQEPIEFIHETAFFDEMLDKIPDGLFDDFSKDNTKYCREIRTQYLSNKLRKNTKRQRIAFAAQVVTISRRLEHDVYIISTRLNKNYKYNLITDFRAGVSRVRYYIRKGFALNLEYKDEKIYWYNQAQAELDNVEDYMWHMVQPDMQIITNKRWAFWAIMVDDLNRMLERLIYSLQRSESESGS
jgi:hypothetical protein